MRARARCPLFTFGRKQAEQRARGRQQGLLRVSSKSEKRPAARMRVSERRVCESANELAV
eukprot:3848757-Pleurochrysis_carterae.AAC.1